LHTQDAELLLRDRPTFIVDTAFNAETALIAIRTHDYDVVVSDLVLPRLDKIRSEGLNR
jgi:DNA-binding response OmpR family regulator